MKMGDRSKIQVKGLLGTWQSRGPFNRKAGSGHQEGLGGGLFSWGGVQVLG